MNINVAASFNQKYLRYAYVMLTSLLDNQDKDANVSVYVLESDITDEGKVCLEELFKGYSANIFFLHIDPIVFPKNLKTNEAWSLEIYYRLLLPKLINDVETILYMDVDVIVNKSLKELFNLNWNNKMVYAYPDVNASPFGDIRDELLKEPISRGYQYFCSGIMVMNLKKIREQIDVSDFWKLADEWNYEMIAPDQDLLNGMFCDDVGYLEDKYSVFAKLSFNQGFTYEDIKENACIIHFAGDKPWQGQYVHYNIEQLWWDYAKKTPYYSELLEEFVSKSVNDNLIYDTLTNSVQEKEMLRSELVKAMELIEKLSQLIK